MSSSAPPGPHSPRPTAAPSYPRGLAANPGQQRCILKPAAGERQKVGSARLLWAAKFRNQPFIALPFAGPDEPCRRPASARLHAAWRLSLYGLRRGEVLGLRWSDIDLKQGRQALVKIHHIV